MIEGTLEVKLSTVWTDEKQRRWEESAKRRAEERESLRRNKIQAREKVGKSRNTVFFKWFVAPEGRKVGSLKRRVWSPVGRWEMKNCMPLRREAHFEVKMYKAHHARTTFGSWDVEKVHAVVRHEAHLQVKKLKTPHVRTTFGSWDVVSRGRCKGLCTLSKVSKTWGFCNMKRWQAWDIWRGSAKMHFPWQAQYKRHAHQSC